MWAVVQCAFGVQALVQHQNLGLACLPCPSLHTHCDQSACPGGSVVQCDQPACPIPLHTHTLGAALCLCLTLLLHRTLSACSILLHTHTHTHTQQAHCAGPALVQTLCALLLPVTLLAPCRPCVLCFTPLLFSPVQTLCALLHSCTLLAPVLHPCTLLDYLLII